ncbi:ParB N-terminal domain-containing protein [Paenibacillus sp. OAE614]|uniref:ParB N-terminal domain-containing protein n=1 Tax=Paenibacillus sp. OAE614 TaxID=2663804 RepID=UPI00178BC108
MIYGSTKCAIEYAQRGAIDEWIQLFLRNDGDNVALADGLLEEKRYYIGPVITDISEFGIEEGAPSYLTKENDIAWFFHVVDKMKDAYGDWDFPPLIVFYSAGKYEIADGRHRNEAFRQMKIKQVPVIFWTDTEEDFRYMIEHNSSMGMNLG